jgi:hypothetical protein
LTLQQQRRERRLQRYQQVIDLYAKGYSKKAISRELASFPNERRRIAGRQRSTNLPNTYSSAGQKVVITLRSSRMRSERRATVESDLWWRDMFLDGEKRKI